MLTVLHVLGWLSALSLTLKEGNILSHLRIDRGAEDETECVWILPATEASLDIDTSVALSVIVSLLLISGDVEENPGPGHRGKSSYFCASVSYSYKLSLGTAWIS